MVEGTGLENRQAGNRLVGSNPTFFATVLHGCHPPGRLSMLRRGAPALRSLTRALDRGTHGYRPGHRPD